MAERRMFAKSIVLSDAFIDMPATARCLYFTLSMFADDDGFVGSPRAIMRQIGASDDDLKVLLGKRYVLGFESGVIVIKHWRINNYLQNDRCKPTTYIEEKATLTLDGKNAYTEKDKCIQGVYTQNSIDKISLDYIKDVQNDAPDYATEFAQLWQKYPNKKGKDDAFRHYKVQRKEHSFEEISKKLDEYISYIRRNNTEKRYILNGSTWFNGRWKDEYGVKQEVSYDSEKVKARAERPIVYTPKNKNE